MRVRLERNRGPIYFAAAVLAAALVLLPTPYSLILPGRAVDLRDVVTVSGRSHDASYLAMTDVTFVPRVRLLGLVEALQPGAHIVKSDQVVPDGQDAIEYEDAMREAMSESQSIAAAVAERAAGFKVPLPRGRLMVVYFSASAPSKSVLRFGDMILSVNGQPTPARANVQRALSRTRPGAKAQVRVLRRGGAVTLAVPTIDYDGRPALGVYLTSIYERPHLPVGVAFHLPKVSGSSAGLMF
ncbi:MAG: PDZ domain-containing protein, partial [Candidatus Eremiobacteraeota bacterium]|nr:PDZ domain-containing protein [Candidatus Eremiobacteraeota bacterium]